MLRRFSPFLLGIVALSWTSVAAVRADLDAGKRAYEHGDYSTALKELTRSPNGGAAMLKSCSA